MNVNLEVPSDTLLSVSDVLNLIAVSSLLLGECRALWGKREQVVETRLGMRHCCVSHSLVSLWYGLSAALLVCRCSICRGVLQYLRPVLTFPIP